MSHAELKNNFKLLGKLIFTSKQYDMINEMLNFFDVSIKDLSEAMDKSKRYITLNISSINEVTPKLLDVYYDEEDHQTYISMNTYYLNSLLNEAFNKHFVNNK